MMIAFICIGLKNLDIINTTKGYNFYRGNSSNSPILEVLFNVRLLNYTIDCNI